MISNRDKLEPRGDNEPKFDPHNKTDRKIALVISLACGILSIIAAGLFLIYYFLMK